ncbi:N-acetylmuramidase family protein [Arenibaculum pallidiluteum]|uniref:N-acetylmuramidase family protein n=1 Tax=Arenibaculum pallidiluteum TaxID=2812559 RepID=UPI001A96512D|nr:N-acetylmuramidase family protein [Arenibaculum pallidiluteum]
MGPAMVGGITGASAGRGAPPQAFRGPGTPLADADVARAAAALGCEPAVLSAVIAVETGGRGGFLDEAPPRRPRILFEAHVFSRLTAGRWDASHPGLSRPRWGGPGTYGPAGAHQHERLAHAAALNGPAALQACSWGLFQILGENHRLCGFEDPESFARAMARDEAAQLDAFLAFVRARGLVPLLRARDWTAFARRYNGPGQAGNRYDARLAAAYERHAVEEA